MRGTGNHSHAKGARSPEIKPPVEEHPPQPRLRVRGRDRAVEGEKSPSGSVAPGRGRFGGETRPNTGRAPNSDCEIGGAEVLRGNARRSGDHTQSTQENETKDTRPKPHFVLTPLRSVVARARSAAAEGSMPS